MLHKLKHVIGERRQLLYVVLMLSLSLWMAYRGLQPQTYVVAAGQTMFCEGGNSPQSGESIPFQSVSDEVSVDEGRFDYATEHQKQLRYKAIGTNSDGIYASNTTSSFAWTPTGIVSKAPAGYVGGYDESRASEPKKDLGASEKVIKNAEVGCRVEKFDEATKRFLEIIRKYNGRTDKEEQNNSQGYLEGIIVARIETGKFDTFLNDILAVSVYTENKTIKAEDITAEFIDNETRLKTKREVESRLLALLAKATKVNDMVEIETQLGTVREEIESIEGKLKYWQDLVSYSTITLTYSEKVTQANLPPEETFSGKFVTSLKNGWSGFLGFVLSIISNWAMWILLLVVFFAGWKWIKRLDKKRREKQEQTIVNG